MNEYDVILARYKRVVSDWRNLEIDDRASLAAALGGYRIYFAYNSGKIENANITYHDMREIFENGRAVGFTGDVRTLFEIQNQKECHELLLDAFAERRPTTATFLSPRITYGARIFAPWMASGVRMARVTGSNASALGWGVK